MSSLLRMLLLGLLALSAGANDRLFGTWRAKMAGETLELRLDADGTGRFDTAACRWKATDKTLTFTYAGGVTERVGYRFDEGRLVLSLEFGRLPFRRVDAGDPRLVGVWAAQVGERDLELRLAEGGRAVLLGQGGVWYTRGNSLFLDLADEPTEYTYELAGDRLTLTVAGASESLALQRGIAPPSSGAAAPTPKPPTVTLAPSGSIVARTADPQVPPADAAVNAALVGHWRHVGIHQVDGGFQSVTRQLRLNRDGTFAESGSFTATVGTAAAGERGTWSATGDRLYLRFADGTGADSRWELADDTLLLRQGAQSVAWERQNR